ncbi:MAG: hypothetical protein EHM83_10525 [Burkholderiales bacterium]|nr:MAG: hypothetical protein EHM83_10525 [Burkholderiales bacterium]
MSRVDPAFAYAQARMQSRFGERPVAADWQHLEATRDLGAVLQVLRGGKLARWTGRFAARPGVHEIERRLREEWLRAVDEVAAWQPEGWREATRWMRWIVHLPALQKLARGGRAPAWMRADAVLGPIVAREPRERGPALMGTPLAPLAAGFADPPDVARAWATHWQELWPRDAAARAPLAELLAAIRASRARLAQAPPEATSRDSIVTLERRLAQLFRRNPLSPTATAAYVSLMQLDLQRVRGLLAVRALRDAPVAAP